jgi:aryl-alcohol dehydrogenase-like predicted oxidoreductase
LTQKNDPAASDTQLARRARLVLGTADLCDDHVAPALLHRFTDSGGRALDLANVYNDGESNRTVGRWLAQNDEEPRLYVKGCHPPYCSPGLIRAEVDKARGDLGVETLDVFILHRDDEGWPVSAFGEALLAEVARGSIGAFGVSNWTLARLGELADALGEDGERLTVFSNHFSLATMVTPVWPGCLAMGQAEIEWLAAAGRTAMAWASLAAGYFARRASPAWSSPENERRRVHAEKIAVEHRTSATVVALAYVLHQPDHLLPVVSTASASHLDELLSAASNLNLTPAELAYLVE